MEIVHGLSFFRQVCREPHVLSLGNFDGVHLGHRAILQATVDAAKELGGKSSVLIFTPHPLQVLAPERFPALLISMDDRLRLLAAAGIDYAIVHRFTREFAAITPETFAKEILKELLDVNGVVVGFDYTFGRYGTGGTEEMQNFGKAYQFTVKVIEPVTVNGMPVGSSRIRTLLLMGRVEDAAQMLGYPFYLRGRVVSGDGRGRKLGFPTANVQSSCEVIQPGHGVYLTRVLVAGQSFWGVTNVGRRPTFCMGELAVEVYLLDISENLYGQELTVEFWRKIRDEKAFANSTQLVEQISQDVAGARQWINHIILAVPFVV